VKVHWNGRAYTFAYLIDPLLNGGAGGGGNLTVECIRRTLNALPRRAGRSCPSELYVQMDNCGENKNRTVFAFFDHLVHLGHFQQIQVGFLAVGHTHDDIGK
jgi:hypothetical protein